MKKRLLIILIVLAVTLIIVPVSFIITIFLTPLWSLMESATGLESIGHSGPADWCFIAVYIFLLAAAIIFLYYQFSGKKNKFRV